jgi:uncharacterized membrane protein YbhN (UPF0104 family)
MLDRPSHALDVFAHHIGSIGWAALGAAAACHLLRMTVRTRAWRNIVAAAYPDAIVRWRGIFGAYTAGAAVNALVPARGGDALKLFLTKRQIADSTYPTLVGTLVVETLLDVVLSTALLVWALQLRVLPGLDVLPRLRSIDWSWAERHPRLALGVAFAALLASVLAAVWARAGLRELGAQIRAGGAILRKPTLYFSRVVPWQLADWALRLATVYWLLRAFGIDATARNVLLVQVTQSLSTLLPLTPGGIGTEQGLLVYVFSGKAAAARVLSFSIGMKVALTTINLAIGFSAIAFMLRTLRWRRALADQEPRLSDG